MASTQSLLGSLREAIFRRSRATRVWTYNAFLGGLVVVLWAVALRHPAAQGVHHLPWWLVGAGLVLLEKAAIPIITRGGTANNIGLAQNAVIVGLFTLTPAELLLAVILWQAVPAVNAARHHRPAWTMKVAFNALSGWAVAGAMALVFYALLPSGPVDLQGGGVLAAMAAAVTAVLSDLATPVVIWLFGAGFDPELFRYTVTWSIVCGCVLTAITVLGLIAGNAAPDVAWLVLLPSAALLVLARSTVAAREQARRVATLCDVAATMQAARTLEDALPAMLIELCQLVGAVSAEMVLDAQPDTGAEGSRTIVRSGRTVEVLAPLDDDVPPSLSGTVEWRRRRAPREWREWAAARGVREAIVVPVLGTEHPLGTLALCNRFMMSGHWSAKDRQLIELAAAQLAATVEKHGVVELERTTVALRRQALHDPLTDLGNALLLRERVEHALLRLERSLSSVALVFIDLDGFKPVNDTHGHAAGDELLCTVADRLRATVRRPDTAVRLGGDEFVVFLEDIAGPDDASAVAGRILESLGQPVTVGGGAAVTIGASIGVAVARGGERITHETLLQRADSAMYEAKAAGKGTVVRWRPGTESAAVAASR